MERPTPATVRGNFDGVQVEDTRFVRRGEQYFVEVATSSGTFTRHRVAYTFGFEPLQQYLLEAPGGRLQAYAMAWDVAGERWYRVQSPDLPWHGRYQNWNMMCAECHSTGVQKGYNSGTDRYQTTFSEEDVACQACHGPGSAHALDPQVNLQKVASAESCAPCHSRRSNLDDSPARGGDFSDHYRLSPLQPGLYHPDGQILDEVFEYGSFNLSRMHRAGVTCVDCHEPHGLRASNDDATCTRCHGPTPPVGRFPTLAARQRSYDSPEHHHHPTESPGARCVACHLPERTYLGVDVRHDHGFQRPRPDLSLKLGTPDGCTNTCHAGKDSAWSASQVALWFPGPKPPHFGEVLARAWRGEEVQVELQRLVLDRDQSELVRASALESMLSSRSGCPDLWPNLAKDPSALVRSVAVACASLASPPQRAQILGPALDDPSRLVRVETARALAGPSAKLLDPGLQAAYGRARDELLAADRTQLDRPEGPFNLGLLAEAEGDPEGAMRLYRQALRLDPRFRPARVNLRLLQRPPISPR
jgi:hypothetical protein